MSEESELHFELELLTLGATNRPRVRSVIPLIRHSTNYSRDERSRLENSHGSLENTEVIAWPKEKRILLSKLLAIEVDPKRRAAQHVAICVGRGTKSGIFNVIKKRRDTERALVARYRKRLGISSTERSAKPRSILMPHAFSAGSPIGVNTGQRAYQRSLVVIDLAGTGDDRARLTSARPLPRTGEIVAHLAAAACRSVVLDRQADEPAHPVAVEQQQYVALSRRLL